MRFDDFRAQAFKLALEKGCESAELFMQDSEETSVKVLEGKVDSYDYSHTTGANLRVKYQGRDGCYYTESFEDAEKAVSKAIDNSLFSTSEEHPWCSESVDSYDMEGVDLTAEMMSPGDLISLALDAEKYALESDKRVLRMDYNGACTVRQTTLICNTLGQNSAYTKSAFFTAISPIVGEGDEVRDSFAYLSGADARNSKVLAKTATAMAIAKLGARPVAGGDYKIILQSKVATDMLGIFCSQFSAEAAQKGLSPLEGKEGTVIAAPCVTIIDDPLHKYNPRPFDDEGVASVVTPVIHKGKFISLLHNLKTAKKAGVKSTSNGGRAGVASGVGVAPSNFILQEGDTSLEMMMREMGDGLLICEVAGQHAGANAVTGDFSLMASGFKVEGGKVAYPVDQIIIAGNWNKLLLDIEKVGNDTFFNLPIGSVFASPSLYIPKGIKVSGE